MSAPCALRCLNFLCSQTPRTGTAAWGIWEERVKLSDLATKAGRCIKRKSSGSGGKCRATSGNCRVELEATQHGLTDTTQHSGVFVRQ
eukprot:6491314-Amphidinium_carterae.3